MNTKAILLTAGGITTLGGLGVAGFWMAQVEDIKGYLTSSGKTLLDTKGTDNDAEWKILFTQHKETKVTVNNKEIAKIITDIGTDEANGIIKLKTECNKLFETKVSNNNDWEKQKDDAINWCTLESSILKAEKDKLASTPKPQTGAGKGGPGSAVFSSPSENH